MGTPPGNFPEKLQALWPARTVHVPQQQLYPKPERRRAASLTKEQLFFCWLHVQQRIRVLEQSEASCAPRGAVTASGQAAGPAPAHPTAAQPLPWQAPNHRQLPCCLHWGGRSVCPRRRDALKAAGGILGSPCAAQPGRNPAQGAQGDAKGPGEEMWPALITPKQGARWSNEPKKQGPAGSLRT